LVVRLLRADSSRAAIEKFLVSMLINVFGTPEETADAVGDVHPETAAEVLHRVSTSLGAGDLSFIIAISVALSDNVLSSVSENSNDNRRFLTQRFLASFYDAALNHMPSEESQAFIKVFDDVNLIFPHSKSVLTRYLVVDACGLISPLGGTQTRYLWYLGSIIRLFHG
jgi:hypothetical protein